jgi:hypothetical protein
MMVRSGREPLHGGRGTLRMCCGHGARGALVVDDGDHLAVAGAHLLDVGEHLLQGGVAREEAHHGHVAVDERQGAVLHLAAGVALGVDVRDLLELERALQGDGAGEPAAEEERVARVHDGAGHGLDVARRRRGPRASCGAPGRTPRGGRGGLAGDRAAAPADVDGEHREGRELGGEALGAGDADLGARVGVEGAVGHAGDGAPLHVDHREDAGAAGAWPPWRRRGCRRSRPTARRPPRGRPPPPPGRGSGTRSRARPPRGPARGPRAGTARGATRGSWCRTRGGSRA